jgi:hypothetical protein
VFASIAATTLLIGVSAPVEAAARPLAALAAPVPDAAPPSSASAALDTLTQKYLDEPGQWAGTWYDHQTRQVVAAVPASATAATRSTAGSIGSVRIVSRSFADLKSISDTIIERPSIASERVTTTGIDWQNNAVVVGVERVTDSVRAALAAEFGDAVTVRQVPRAMKLEGPDRWRDRYPYWGGSAWLGQTDNTFCSTAFGMRREDRSKKFLLTAGHCNDSGQNAATMNTAGTSWDNVIGTSAGYANSTCGTPSSCLIGSTRYGDISIIRVSGIEPRIYHGGARATSSIPVIDTQYAHPKVGDSMCTSGKTTGSVCGYKVTNNFTSLRYNDANGNYMGTFTPMVETRNTSGHCVIAGDSGGAVYKPEGSGAIASGVISAGTTPSSDCLMFYTSIYYAQKLFDVVTETTP